MATFESQNRFELNHDYSENFLIARKVSVTCNTAKERKDSRFTKY